MHRKYRFLRSHAPRLAASLLLCAAGNAWAADDHASPFTLSGFGSVGFLHADARDADYTSSVLKPSGAGFSKRWSEVPDTRLGAQLDAQLGQQWSAVLQVVSEKRLDGSWRPQVEWANLKYQATPELALRVGRIALPIFLAADYRKVGYAYPWARTPIEVYDSLPIGNSDGIDLTYRYNGNGMRNVTQLLYGRTDIRLVGPDRVRGRQMAGFSNTTDIGAASIRVSGITADLSADLANDLFAALRQFGPPGVALADQYQVAHKRASLFSVGANYDPGNWFLTAEYGRAHSTSVLGTTNTIYASSGWRLGEITPYVSYARVQPAGATSDPGLPVAFLPPPLQPTAAALNGYLNLLLSTIPGQRTVSLGARWDCMRNVALKLQADRVVTTDGSRGRLINVQPGFRSGQAITVTSVVLDFVF